MLLSDQCVHTIKLAVFEGSKKTIFRDRRELTGSLLKQVEDAFSYIDQHNRTRAEFSGLERVDNRDYPTEALREALTSPFSPRETGLSYALRHSSKYRRKSSLDLIISSLSIALGNSLR